MEELIIRVIKGQATSDEEARVRAWCEEAPENEAEFRALKGIWAVTEPDVSAGYGPPPTAAEIVDAAARASSVVSLDEVRPRRFWSRRRLLPGVAAAAALAAVALGIRWLADAGPGAQPVASYLAEAGQAASVVLNDGSVARLAPGARLSLWADDDERRYTLEGRAFFVVEHDARRPFVVEAAGGEVRVLGTRFEVLEGGDDIRAVVVEGRVALSTDGGQVEVPAGAVAQATRGAPPEVREVEDVFGLLDWPGGLLVFRGTPLRMVAEEVSRHFGRTVDVRGPELRELRIVASFEEEGFEDVVLALCDISGAACTLNDDGALLEPGAQ